MSENTRYVPAEASFTEPTTGERVESAWGVLDTVENTFAPFGGDEELATFAAQRVEEKPWLPWSFLPDFTLAAPRFEWIEATYAEYDGESSTAYGAVDNELGRFYPFSHDADDPDASAFVADVAKSPEGKYSFAAPYTKTN
ncbi:hypothetical protein SEA_TUCK_57 [Arthrobacter phage Tuck]|uniref:Uncharacterized protein n=1 Tax=Arthrobacter phage Tuck TaxID=2998996 RepID=A0A9E8M9J8_9CAUD|nr:hypothetical protein SEA_TUCK_57 [Arthrobacter phage Tuck]